MRQWPQFRQDEFAHDDYYLAQHAFWGMLEARARFPAWIQRAGSGFHYTLLDDEVYCLDVGLDREEGQLVHLTRSPYDREVLIPFSAQIPAAELMTRLPEFVMASVL